MTVQAALVAPVPELDLQRVDNVAAQRRKAGADQQGQCGVPGKSGGVCIHPRNRSWTRLSGLQFSARARPGAGVPCASLGLDADLDIVLRTHGPELRVATGTAGFRSVRRNVTAGLGSAAGCAMPLISAARRLAAADEQARGAIRSRGQHCSLRCGCSAASRLAATKTMRTCCRVAVTLHAGGAGHDAARAAAGASLSGNTGCARDVLHTHACAPPAPTTAAWRSEPESFSGATERRARKASGLG